MAGSRSKRKRKFKTPPEHGLYAKNYTKPVQWKVDFDYLDKLSDEERRWLSDFSNSYYGGDFRSQHGSVWFPHERREAHVAKNAARRDVYALGQVSNRVDFIPDLEKPPRVEESKAPRFEIPANPKADFSPTPEYLNSESYRAAVEEYRDSLPQRGRGRKSWDPRRHEAAKKRLERVIRHGQIPADVPASRTKPPRDDDHDPEAE
jgi:hypothetical protein